MIGQYAMAWQQGAQKMQEPQSLNETVRAWREHWPSMLTMPHPSPRNNIWLKANPWIVDEVVPALQARVRALLAAV
jgi:uracil-DNA glycosylase